MTLSCAPGEKSVSMAAFLKCASLESPENPPHADAKMLLRYMGIFFFNLNVSVRLIFNSRNFTIIGIRFPENFVNVKGSEVFEFL